MIMLRTNNSENYTKMSPRPTFRRPQAVKLFGSLLRGVNALRVEKCRDRNFSFDSKKLVNCVLDVYTS